MERNGNRIKIDGHIYHVTKVYDGGYLPMIETEEGEDFYLAESSEEAGQKAREYWADMAENDPKEFACIVGEETLIQWGMGHSASPGSIAVSSLQEWLDLTSEYPEEHFAGYDGVERDVEKCGHIEEEIGFCPAVAYRHN